MDSEELRNDMASLIPQEWGDFLSLYKQAKEKQDLGVSLTAQEKQLLIDLHSIAAEIDGWLIGDQPRPGSSAQQNAGERSHHRNTGAGRSPLHALVP